MSASPSSDRSAPPRKRTHVNRDVLAKIESLYTDIFEHDGYGELRIEMRILRRGQKEVILHCGKQFRFVVDYEAAKPEG
ncbi:MAG: hypothetical protein AAF458_21870 [Pseudomonadota bacterium]